MKNFRLVVLATWLSIAASWTVFLQTLLAAVTVYNVQEYGASGQKNADATPAIQKAVDACAGAGGGLVLLPSGEYTCGTITMRSHIRLLLEAGCTLYASKDEKVINHSALIYGENLEDISIEGRGKIDGQAEYTWMDKPQHIDMNIYEQQLNAEKSGFPLQRTYPSGSKVHPFMIFLINCNNISIRDLSFVRSRSWTIHPWGCENVVISGISIFNSVTEGVWADGIDIDCCKDVHISDCTIQAGDDAIVLKTSQPRGLLARPCENVTVTNCRLTSASCALKLGTESFADFRHIVFDNCVIRNSNRGIGICVRDGATVDQVIFSNLTIECTRHAWFWWGNGEPIWFVLWKRNENSRLGSIKNVLVQNVLATAQGSSLIEGFPGRPLQGITLNQVKIIMSEDSTKDRRTTHALICKRVDDLKVTDLEIKWQEPRSEMWKSAFVAEEIHDLSISHFSGRQGVPANNQPVIALNQVIGAELDHCHAEKGSNEFLHLSGNNTQVFFCLTTT
jgi:hypothetical protein